LSKFVEEMMKGIPWKKIILSALILTFLVGSSGCQAGTQAVKNLEKAIDEIGNIPQRLAQVVGNIMGGIGDIGGALADQIGNIIGGMTGH
jgi:hypothetical protein